MNFGVFHKEKIKKLIRRFDFECSRFKNKEMRFVIPVIFLFSFSSMAATVLAPSKKILLPTEIESALKLPTPAPKWIVIDFWASWCGPCEASAPFYSAQAKKWKDQGVYFVGMNQDEEESAQKAWLKEHDASFAQIFDKDHKFAGQLDVSSLPRLLVFDQDRKLVKTVQGFRNGEFADNLEKDFAVLFTSKNNKKETSKGSHK